MPLAAWPRSRNYWSRGWGFRRPKIRRTFSCWLPTHTHTLIGSKQINIQHGKYAFLICTWIKLDDAADAHPQHTHEYIVRPTGQAWTPAHIYCPSLLNDCRRAPSVSFLGTRNLYKLILTRGGSWHRLNHLIWWRDGLTTKCAGPRST